jgi:hypothetical protein
MEGALAGIILYEMSEFNGNVTMFTGTEMIQLMGLIRERMPIAVVEQARTVFARSNTAIVGSNPTEAWMFVCVLCAFFMFLHSIK